MPLLFSVDVKYDLPRSRAAFGARVEEVKKKKIAKAPRRASSRVVGRGAIIETTPVMSQSGLSGTGSGWKLWPTGCGPSVSSSLAGSFAR